MDTKSRDNNGRRGGYNGIWVMVNIIGKIHSKKLLKVEILIGIVVRILLNCNNYDIDTNKDNNTDINNK